MASGFRALRLRSREEFDRVFEHVTHEAYRARTHWEFWVAMEEAFGEYSREINLAPGFWEVTRRAHQEALILRLARLYDPHPAAVTLGNLLCTLKEKASLAGTILPAQLASVDMTDLDADIASVSDQESSVEKVLTVRNEYLAHRGTQHVTKGTFDALPKLKKEDFSGLLTNAIRIMTKYREAFGYPYISWGQQEAREFKELLVTVRAGRPAEDS